jgi:hypothetical protein
MIPPFLAAHGWRISPLSADAWLLLEHARWPHSQFSLESAAIADGDLRREEERQTA